MEIAIRSEGGRPDKEVATCKPLLDRHSSIRPSQLNPMDTAV